MPREPERRPGAAIETSTAPGPAPEWLRGAVSPRDGAGPTLLTGHLRGIDDEGRLLFAAEGDDAPVPVGIGIEIPDGTLVRAARRGARALVARTSDPTPRWLLVGLVRERIGPVASFKSCVVVGRLPKTRSGKILRSTMAKIADDAEYRFPATIDDPAVLGEIAEALKPIGYAAKHG